MLLLRLLITAMEAKLEQVNVSPLVGKGIGPQVTSILHYRGRFWFKFQPRKMPLRPLLKFFLYCYLFLFKLSMNFIHSCNMFWSNPSPISSPPIPSPFPPISSASLKNIIFWLILWEFHKKYSDYFHLSLLSNSSQITPPLSLPPSNFGFLPSLLKKQLTES